MKTRTLSLFPTAVFAFLPLGAQAQTVAESAPGPDNDIVVTATRASKNARAEEKAAPNLINVQAAEDIVKYPDFNAAEALGRVPGVSLAIDTGEGRFVNIRGIDGNLNGTTFGGVTLLNTQPGGTYFGGGGRAVELDTVPIGAVDRLVVRKSGLPDQEAEGLGGSVELTPRTAVGLHKPFVEGTIGGGYQSAHKNGDVFIGEAAAGTAFGPDKQFAIVLTGSFHTDKRGFDDVEPGLLDAVQPGAPGDRVLDALDLRRYSYNRRRFGFGGELDWNPDAQSHYYIRANDAGYTESVHRSILQYRGLGDTIATSGNVITASGVDARVTLRDEQETHLNFIAAAGGRNDFDKLIVDYQFSYTASTYHRDYDRNSTFTRPGRPTFTVAYDNITGLYPTLTPTGFNPSDPTQFTLTGANNATERAHDREYAAVLNVTVPTTLLGGDGRFQVGGKLRFRDKIDQPNNVSYAGVPTTPLSAVLGGGPYTDYYNGTYNVGYAPSILAMRAVLAPLAQFTSAANAQRNAQGFFNDTENVYAGYAQYSGTFGKLGVLAGVRVENTDGTYRGTTIADGNVFTPASRKSRYTNVFPTVQLRYELMPQVIARATYSTGIGRPGFLQLLSGAVIDTGNLAVSVGNPGLKPTTVNAFDAQLEYYMADSGILSVGGFDKEFNNYIVNNLQQNTTYVDAGGTSYAGYDVTSYTNVKSSHARGIEAQYNQKLSFLPAPFDGFGVLGNVTYVWSQFAIRPGEGSRLPGTSPLTYNLAAYYEAHGLQLRLSLSHVDAAIFGVGGGSGFDTFEDQRTQLDLTSSYQVTRNMAVYFNAKNLNNSPLRYYEGLSNRTTQREFYDQSYEAGFRFKF
ncbi:TonB-dependent receptor [Sphingomonas sp. CARO-RG-8B-R24-01]|uniref:TonB-dependent receptor n=1 Tax=Sphingomonas sp. CARO-RG-8B-R24-01 TaxID=2914831 RepID=UPI001F594B83|nr:TonB-dependent receptor [Sphingomonas sp. CARO-RG-8B-R24-01]